MPKNANGEIVCINHPEKVLSNKTYVSMPIANIDNVDGDARISISNEHKYLAAVTHCEDCGYVETYTVQIQDLLPSKE